MDFDSKTFVLGIGAQKGGTTWLHDYLSGRGDVYMPRKEMHYFDIKYRPDLRGRKARKRAENGTLKQRKPNSLRDPDSLKDGSAYRDFFRTRVPEDLSVFGEITPAYSLIGEEGYREIRGLFRNIRIIFILRDPVDRFYSHVRMAQDRRSKKGKEEAEAETLLDDPAYRERSAYDVTISNLENVFASGEIAYLFYERLFCTETIALLCEFLGLPYMPADFSKVINASSARGREPGPLDARARAVFDPTYRFCREKFGPQLPAEWRTAL
jgi:hypothetical protein